MFLCRSPSRRSYSSGKCMSELQEPLLMSQTVDITDMMNSEFQRLKKYDNNNDNINEYTPIATTTAYQSVDDVVPLYGVRAINAEASFLRRRDREKNSVVLVYEMDSKEGFQPMRAISLRALLYEVLHEVEPTEINAFKSSQSLPNLDKESDTTHGNKEAEVSSEIGHDPVIGVQGIPVDDTDENSGNLTTLQSSVGTSLQHSRGRPPTGAPSSLLSKHPPNRLSQRNLNIDHRNHSHTHGVCHDETTGRLNHSGVIASSDISHLMSSVALGLRLRDLRRLDFSINPNEQLDVQVRRHVVLFSIDTLRCIITANKVRIIVPSGADTFVRYLEDYIGGWQVLEREKAERSAMETPLRRTPQNSSSSIMLETSHGALAFEVFIYETLLAIVKEIITTDVIPLKLQVKKVTDYFTNGNNVSPLAQDKIRYLKDRITRISAKLNRYHDSLDDIMADDETMALMNLTSLASKPTLYNYPLSHEIIVQHEEVEEALESYLADFSTLESDLDQLKRQLDNTEVQASLRLDMARNKVLVANIILTIVSANITFGAYITGIFGMNLDNTVTIQPINGVFEVVFIGTFILMIVSSIFVYYYFVWQGVIVEDDAETEKLFLM